MTRSQPVALLGEAPPRVLVKPQGVRANSARDVADLSATFGVRLDGWQQTILEAAQGERADSMWAARRVGITVPRQNGKSQLMVARILAGALLFGERKIVVSAHQQDTAREAFAKLMEIIESDSNSSLQARVKSVMNAINRESVKFTNGATVQFKARSGPGGKGFSSDCLLLDEAQILGSRAWTSINSTMSAMPNPQVWLLGTSPQDEDDSFAFDAVRRSAVDGKSTNAAWCEWGVSVESEEYRVARADLEAKRWTPEIEYLCWSGNPAWNTRLNLEVVRGEFETYDKVKFAQDRLGAWLDDTITRGIVDADEWDDLAIDPADAPTDGVQAFAVKFSADGERVSAAVALRPDDGPVHVEGFGVQSIADGVAQLVPWLADRWRDSAVILLDGKAGAGDLLGELRAAGVPKSRVRLVTTDEAITAHAGMLRAINEGDVTHLAQPGLDAQVQVAGKRKIGQAGGWGWRPVTPDGDVTGLDAVTLARHGAVTTRQKTNKRGGDRATSGRRGAVL